MNPLRAALAILLSLGLHAALAAVVAQGLAGDGETAGGGTVAVTVTLIEAPGEDGTEETATLTDIAAPEAAQTADDGVQAEASVDTPGEVVLPFAPPPLPEKPPLVALAAADIAAALPRLAMPSAAPAVPEPDESAHWPDLPQTVAVLPTPRPDAAPRQAPSAPKVTAPERNRKKAKTGAGKRTGRKAGKADAGGRDTTTRQGARGKAAGPSAAAIRNAMASYGQRVNSHVARRKPRGANGRGTVGLSLRIARSGALLGASVSSSSGDPSLDSKALQAARGAAPYPRPPEDVPGRSLALRIRLSFR